MQILIESLENERPSTLRRLAAFLLDYVSQFDAAEAPAPLGTGPLEPEPAADDLDVEIPVTVSEDTAARQYFDGVPPGTMMIDGTQRAAPEIAMEFTPTGIVLPFEVPTPPAPTAMAPAISTLSLPSAPAAAPVAPPATSPAVTATAITDVPVEYDSSGLAWDGRIHQDNRNKKKDGTWMLKRRIDAAHVEEVTKELIGRKKFGIVMGIPKPEGTPAVDPNTVFTPFDRTVLVPQPAVFPNASVSTVPLPPVALPMVPPAPAAAAPAAGNPLRDFVMKCAGITKSGRLTQEQINAAVQSVGAPSMQSLGNAQHLIPAASAAIDGLLV